MGVAVVYAVFVRTRLGQEIDQAAFAGRDAASPDSRQAARRALGAITATTLGLAVVALVGIGLARRRPLLAAVPLVAVGAAVLTSEILKRDLLARPDLIGEPQYSNSFPSGHATIAMSVALAATVVAPPRIRPAVAVAGTAFAALIGIAAVAAAWHRPSDVAAGYLVATGWAAGTLGAWARLGPARGGEFEGDLGRLGRVGERYEIAAGVLGVGALAAVVALTLSDAHRRIEWVDPRADFLGAAVVIGAAATGLSGLLALAARRSLRALRRTG